MAPFRRSGSGLISAITKWLHFADHNLARFRRSRFGTIPPINNRVSKIDLEEQEVAVDFDGRLVTYDFSDQNELVLAYAVSIHKSQGSEYPVVVMPIHISHYMLLQRNLIYTGVTRARKLVVIVGTKKALSIGIRNNKIRKRFTGLCRKLRA